MRHAFTLLELLIILVIVSVLIVLAVVMTQRAREASRRMTCTNNLKQLALATHTFHDADAVFEQPQATGVGRS